MSHIKKVSNTVWSECPYDKEIHGQEELLSQFPLQCTQSDDSFSVVGGEQSMSLGMLEDGSMAEIVLFRGLNAEGTLCSHAPNRLVNVQCSDLMQL